ncbi:MAG: hypothetical protein ACFFBP_04205 [Promethearchaeota archaeon]
MPPPYPLSFLDHEWSWWQEPPFINKFKFKLITYKKSFCLRSLNKTTGKESFILASDFSWSRESLSLIAKMNVLSERGLIERYFHFPKENVITLEEFESIAAIS